MARLWIFNPWNDMALANDSIHYTPPDTALQLAKEGETLPLWLAEPGDYVLMGREGREFYKSLPSSLKLAKPWNGEEVEEFGVWGWSKATRQIFINEGISDRYLPDDATLDRWREMSHRRMTVNAHKFINSPNVPIETLTTEDALNALKKWGDVIGKYPWSSSGRGLFAGSLNHTESFLRRCAGAIRHQGSVIIEPQYKVAVDFAMLFMCKPAGRVEYMGLSLFENNKRAYTGNILMPQEEIFERLTQFIPIENLEKSRELLMRFIAKYISPFYEGPLGIDMFIYKNSHKDCSSYGLNACVEINLRYTMGFVALNLQNRFLPDGYHGMYRITSHNSRDISSTQLFMPLNPQSSAFRFGIYGEG